MPERTNCVPMRPPISLPLVPLRDIVVFPHTMVPFVVGRKGIASRRRAGTGRGQEDLFLSTQRNAQDDEPAPPDAINPRRHVATIVQHLKLGNGNVKLLVEGVERATTGSISSQAEGGHFRVGGQSIEQRGGVHSRRCAR